MRRPARIFLRQATAIMAVAAATVLASTDVGFAQITVDATILTNGYSQNFDSMGTSTTASLPTGWKFTAAGAGTTAGWSTALNVTATTQQASSGNPTTGGIYNWGSTTTDRAPGFMTSGSYASPNGLLFGLTNSTTSTITGLTLAFDYERYRVNSAAASVTFFGSTDGSTWTAVTAGDSGAFATGTSAYTFTGGTVVNRSNLTISSLNIGQNQSYYLKWNFNTTGSSSQALGLDNFSAAFTSSGGGGPNYYWVGADTTLGGAGTWAQTGGTAWRATNDNGTGTAWDSTKIATFGGASSGTVTVTGTVNANAGLSFATTGYTLTGGTVSLGGANAAANTITTDTATAIAIDSVLAGSSGLTKAGPGTLTLGGANTYAGGTTVSAGTLSVAADTNLGGSAGGITLGGGRLELTSGFTLGSGRTITAATGTSSTIAVTSGTVSFAGPFTGSGNLDKGGAGRLSVSNASSDYTGTFTISAGTLEITAANAFANATLSQTGGTLLLAPQGGGDVVIPEISGTGGTVSVDSGANAVFRGSSNRGYDGQVRGQGGFKKEGNGILTLTADNDFSGSTAITQGTLKLGANGALSLTPQISIDSGATFDVSSKSGFTLGSGQRLGGRGTVLGDLQFGSGSQIAFDPVGPLLVGSGTVSFAAGFGIASISGLNASVAEGRYTLLNEITGGSFNFTNLSNLGAANAVALGNGKSAYFEQGSLEVVVVPEPAALSLGAICIAVIGLAAARRKAAASIA